MIVSCMKSIIYLLNWRCALMNVVDRLLKSIVGSIRADCSVEKSFVNVEKLFWQMMKSVFPMIKPILPLI